ncbi:MAG TPA: ATP-binding protein [Lacunisphaera sp.]|jgi:hypothetical protein|nr:ATP-binding protein [Lacunisphaera sp.]
MSKEYKISIDPRILELLGPNLYTNIYYVLAELIANAYDADAKNVYVISNKNDIRVEDDGHGMSYKKGDVTKYLDVAAESRTTRKESLTKSGNRRKMGRKGVGKLAALSVSENVDVMTVAGGDKSGFVLSRRIEKSHKLRPISGQDIKFERIKKHGTAIVMKSPQYELHKSLGAVKRNLLKIFPLVSKDFRIHIIRGNESEVIDDFDRNIMKQLVTLITLGHDYSSLCRLVPKEYPKRRKELVDAFPTKKIPLRMRNTRGAEHTYSLEINGWIGTYGTTKGRKAIVTDFPDNFISLFANGKMGEFNILPVVGQNKLNEVYVVGQLHVDLFELTELPDMALSNRQGYKSDDPRYIAVIAYVRGKLLADILRRRDTFTDLRNAAKKLKKEEKQKQDEENLKIAFDDFRDKASKGAASKLSKLGVKLPLESIKKIVLDAINRNTPNLGLKRLVDSQKKRILISQTSADKPFADIVYQMLVFNNVPAEDILYTNCDDEICRIPEERRVFEYLREFFIESYSDQKIFALFITSENTKASWGAITEVGAAWITQIDHKIFNIRPFRPEHPLDDEAQWQSTNRNKKQELWMTPLDADIFCQKIEAVCDKLGYKKKPRAANKAHLETLVALRAR